MTSIFSETLTLPILLTQKPQKKMAVVMVSDVQVGHWGLLLVQQKETEG